MPTHRLAQREGEPAGSGVALVRMPCGGVERQMSCGRGRDFQKNMRTEAGIARPIDRLGALRWAVLSLLCLLLGACGSGSAPPPRQILAEHCVQVGGRLTTSLRVTSPTAGI